MGAGEAARRLWGELRALYEAADSPTLAHLVSLGKQQSPPEKVSDTTLSEWLNGKSVPSRQNSRVFLALVAVLQGRAAPKGTYEPRPEGWWQRLLLEAQAERSAAQRAGRPQRPDGPEFAPAPAGQRRRPAYWATVEEIRRRTGVLTGRRDALADIASFATGSEGYRCLTGKAWAGKTSLLAEAVSALREQVDVICCFLSRTAGSADSVQFLAAVVPQLASLLDEDSLAPGLDEFWALWQWAAERAVRQERHLLLVVDGLDEDLRPPGQPSVTAVLPTAAGGFAHVMVSSRPHPGLPSDVPVGHPLRCVEPVPVQPFSGAQELAALAEQEIDDLLRRDGDGLTTDVLGLLTAAAGPLTARDLAAMTRAAPQTLDLAPRIRLLLRVTAARSVQFSWAAGVPRYRFAHESLLAYAQADDGLNDPDFRGRIHEWADGWQAAGWLASASLEHGTPLYLLDAYPAMLARDPQRLTKLAGDIGWAGAAIASTGVNSVLAELRRAADADPGSTTVAAVLAAVTGQAGNLGPGQPLNEPGYIMRQLWLQTAESSNGDLADDIAHRLQSQPHVRLKPRWTTRRVHPALVGELGRHQGRVLTMAILRDGRVATGAADGTLRIWDPARPGSTPVRLHSVFGRVRSLAALSDGRFAAGGDDMRVSVWDPARPETPPSELGHHSGWILAMTVLPGGRVAAGGADGKILLWDSARPETPPTELGHHSGWILAMTVLPGGRVAAGGTDGKILLWDLSHPGAAPTELGRHQGGIQALAALPGGRVAAGGTDGKILLWDLSHPGAAPTELGHHQGGVQALADMPDGRVASGGRDVRVLAWDPARPKTAPAELGRHYGPVQAVLPLPGGQVVTTGDDQRVLVWKRPQSGAFSAETDSLDERVDAAAVLPDGRVVTCGGDGQILVWGPDLPVTRPEPLGRHDGGVQTMLALPDGRVVTGGRDGRVLEWAPDRPATGPFLLARHRDAVSAILLLSDQRMLTGGVDNRILVCDPALPERGSDELCFFRAPVLAMALLPDRKVVVYSMGGIGGVTEWDPENPDAAPTDLDFGHDMPESIGALPDGRVVAGVRAGKVLLYNPARPESVLSLLGRHEYWVHQLVVLSDGLVVTGGLDNRVKVWDPARESSQIVQLNCSVTTLAAAQVGTSRSDFVVTHEGGGFSVWSFRRDP